MSEQQYIDIPIVALPPPGAVTIILVDEHGAYTARWVSRELIEDRPALAAALEQMTEHHEEARAGR